MCPHEYFLNCELYSAAPLCSIHFCHMYFFTALKRNKIVKYKLIIKIYILKYVITNKMYMYIIKNNNNNCWFRNTLQINYIWHSFNNIQAISLVCKLSLWNALLINCLISIDSNSIEIKGSNTCPFASLDTKFFETGKHVWLGIAFDRLIHFPLEHYLDSFPYSIYVTYVKIVTGMWKVAP